MNTIIVEYEDNFLKQMHPESFETSIHDIKIFITYQIKSSIPSLIIKTEGEAELLQHRILISKIGTLLFLISGAYPNAKKVLENRKEKPLDQLTRKYQT